MATILSPTRRDQERVYYNQLLSSYQNNIPKTEKILYKLITAFLSRTKGELIRPYTELASQEFRFSPTTKSVSDVLDYLPTIEASLVDADPNLHFSPADDWDIKVPEYLKYWKGHFVKLCDETRTDIEQATGKKFGTLLGKIKQDIENNAFSGDPVLRLTEELEKYFDESVAWKARRIAVTESNRINNAGFMEQTEKDDSVVGYEWVLSTDACPLCQAIGHDVNGERKQVKKGEAFALHTTGDPYYSQIFSPPLHPGCRCTVSPVLHFDSTRFSGTALVEKGKVFDPGSPPVAGKPQTDLDEFEDFDFGDEEKPKPKPKPKPKTAKPAKVEEPPAPLPDTQSPAEQYIRSTRDNLRAEVAKYKADSANNVDYARGRPEAYMDRYKRIATLKINAIKEYARYSNYDDVVESQSLSDSELIDIDKAAMEEISFLSDYNGMPESEIRETIEYQLKVKRLSDQYLAKRAGEAIKKIREEVIDILSLPESERHDMEVLHRKEIRSDKRKTVDMAVKTIKEINRMVGKGSKIRKTSITVTSTSKYNAKGYGAHFVENDGEFFIGSDPRMDETSVAHELGHAISLGRNRASTVGISNTSGYAENSWDTWMQNKSSYHYKASAAIRSKGSNVYIEGTANDPFRMRGPYADSNGRYILKEYGRSGDMNELPSVLLETFYRNPVAFVRHIDPEVQAVLFGFLDGSLRE